jgi:hypothetical protein
MACHAVRSFQCSFNLYASYEPYLETSFCKSGVVYFDNILNYSKNLEDHVQHVRAVLCILRNEKLYANLPKSIFTQNKLIFLGFVVSSNDIEVDSSKVEDIHNWPTPTTIGQV